MLILSLSLSRSLSRSLLHVEILLEDLADVFIRALVLLYALQYLPAPLRLLPSSPRPAISVLPVFPRAADAVFTLPK